MTTNGRVGIGKEKRGSQKRHATSHFTPLMPRNDGYQKETILNPNTTFFQRYKCMEIEIPQSKNVFCPHQHARILFASGKRHSKNLN
jgi:hypothetical protein